MDQNPAVACTRMLRSGLVLVLLPALCITTSQNLLPLPPSSSLPRLRACVFVSRANVTCHWDTGDAGTSATTHYTLQVIRMNGVNPTLPPMVSRSAIGGRTYSCTTSNTGCTARIDGISAMLPFCIIVIAHRSSGDVPSAPRCQAGRIEVMLDPVTVDGVNTVQSRPHCLNVTFGFRVSYFAVSPSDIKKGDLDSQIEFTDAEQDIIQVRNVMVRGQDFVVCLFKPDTQYSIRLRNRYQSPQSPWSPWSNMGHGRTAEDAPFAPPAFWRQVKQMDSSGWRLISLLWKPLPHFLANGRVLSYTVTCQTESARVLSDLGTCGILSHTRKSCSLRLPPGRCSCSVTASNSAGTSPQAQIWFLEAPPPGVVTVIPLDDRRLDVCWTAPVGDSVSGFIVEWFAVNEKNSSVLHWERLNGSCRSLVITEGVEPKERYAVSVIALYGERGAGQSRMLHVYTRQGAPSAGPVVEVHNLAGSRVELRWSPLPVELLHGYIRNYTIYYKTTNQPTRRVFVPGHLHHHTTDLLPGNYDIYMQANTDGGAGAAGPTITVHIGPAETALMIYTILPLIVTSLALTLMVCLMQNKMVKEKLCQYVPDPSHSSLAHWTPKSTSENVKGLTLTQPSEAKYSAVILSGQRELETDSIKDCSYQAGCGLLQYSTVTVSEVQMLPNSSEPAKEYIRNTGRTSVTYINDFFPFISNDSNILFLHNLEKSLPTPILIPDSGHGGKLQLGGDVELTVALQTMSTTGSYSGLSQTDGVKT